MNEGMSIPPGFFHSQQQLSGKRRAHCGYRACDPLNYAPARPRLQARRAGALSGQTAQVLA